MENPENTNRPLPEPLDPQAERNMAMFTHLSSLSGCIVPFGHLIGPIILWQINKDRSAYVDAHGKEAVNFQITMTIIFAICIILMFLLIGIPLLIGFGLFDLVVIVIATIKAANGEDYRYPISFRFIK